MTRRRRSSNALDFLYQEWNRKPAAFVSCGGLSGGVRSVQMAKPVLTALKMMPIPEGVAVPFYTKHSEVRELAEDHDLHA